MAAAAAMGGLREQFLRDGFLLLEGFLSEEETNELRAAGEAFTRALPPPSERAVFSTTETQQHKDRYFLASADRLSVFFEADALDGAGELRVPAAQALNKVGHGLHLLQPACQALSFSDKVKDVCKQLKLQQPAVVQSMYIYKNPGVGSEVVPHQDATFLYLEGAEASDALVGFWFALDDATTDNGCLQFIAGSHRSAPLARRLARSGAGADGAELLRFSAPPASYQGSDFQPLPAPRGSCVLIHGHVVHQSAPNRSTQPRHAYTFHVADLGQGQWSAGNWLQLQHGPDAFPRLYDRQ